MAAGAKFAAGIMKGGGYIIGGFGIACTKADIISNGFNGSNTLDLAFGIIGILPGPGWSLVICILWVIHGFWQQQVKPLASIWQMNHSEELKKIIV